LFSEGFCEKVNILVYLAYDVVIKRKGVNSMFEIPMWVLFVLGGIAVSAFMAVKTGKEDKQQENEYIEKEGEVYIKRMEEEKQKKSGNTQERAYEN